MAITRITTEANNDTETNQAYIVNNDGEAWERFPKQVNSGATLTLSSKANFLIRHDSVNRLPPATAKTGLQLSWNGVYFQRSETKTIHFNEAGFIYIKAIGITVNVDKKIFIHGVS